uniref:Secreted protein n=1 Tax=Aotus nancymaae TaxID=37293 RepID=A0A2K5CMS0_AOTNA
MGSSDTGTMLVLLVQLCGNAFYSNVLYRPRGTPKKNEDSSGDRKDQRGQSIYSTSFPKPVTCQPCLAPRPCPSPRPGHPISKVRASPREE